LALNSAIAAGAEAAVIPERQTSVEELENLMRNGIRKSKNSSIVLVAEGGGGAQGLADRIRQNFPNYDVRVSILGHLQRGGSPSAFDRILASCMGVAAVDALLDEQRSVMIGVVNNEIVHVPFAKAIKDDKQVRPEKISVLQILSI
jgi:6-phosphofructokinase 1